MFKKWIGLSVILVCSISLHAMESKNEQGAVSVAQVNNAQQGIIILQKKAIYAVRMLRNGHKLSKQFLSKELHSKALDAFRTLMPIDLFANVEQLVMDFDIACVSKNFGRINYAYQALISMLEVCKNDLQKNYAGHIATSTKLRPTPKPVHGKQKSNVHEQVQKEDEPDFADAHQKPELNIPENVSNASDVQSGTKAITKSIPVAPQKQKSPQPMVPMPTQEEVQQQQPMPMPTLEEFQRIMEEQRQQQQMEQPGFFSSLWRDPIKMLIAASLTGLTVYGVLANIFDWWPFSQATAQQMPVQAQAQNAI